MLINRAELEGDLVRDVRIEQGRISAIGDLEAHPGEPVLQADGGLLLPGLHDHHIHVAAVAASLSSVHCGPPKVCDSGAFAKSLHIEGSGWIRATGYHESVAGMLDARTLDRIISDRPLRVQHRTGRMWFFNSLGLEILLATGPAPAGMEQDGNHYTGRLFDEDAWLRKALASTPPSFAQVGTMLARYGVTGLTDMSPANDAVIARHFAQEMANGALPQRVLMAGTLALCDADLAESMTLGPAKLHLHEADLPPYEDMLVFIRTAHAKGRGVAVHCVTEVELVYALAALDETGTISGDRIEHASVAPDSLIEQIAQLRLSVVSQPHFIAERGDLYLREVEEYTRPYLYRLHAFLDAGVPLAGGSDAPYGSTDPWAAMAAAVSRRTSGGALIGPEEALNPEEALDLYLRAPDALDQRRKIAVGAPADLCLLNRPWTKARAALSADLVRATIIDGRLVFDRVDQPPVQGRQRIDPLA